MLLGGFYIRHRAFRHAGRVWSPTCEIWEPGTPVFLSLKGTQPAFVASLALHVLHLFPAILPQAILCNSWYQKLPEWTPKKPKKTVNLTNNCRKCGPRNHTWKNTKNRWFWKPPDAAESSWDCSENTVFTFSGGQGKVIKNVSKSDASGHLRAPKTQKS